jgi:copper(I)-binding protein/cytochrome oxidase Cu insertion factor (SCO1/SenC/PrrC family)
MNTSLWLTTAVIILNSLAAVAGAASPWGSNYFPNVTLTTSEGNTVRFFDDLIKDRIVAINFIYTSCPDTCPLETAQLVKVQNIMGDRVGKDVFFYSITIDPEHDTPAVLQEYKERFGADWTFLTGENGDITSLRRKMGLYIEEIQDGSNNHNVSMIIGNQATGRWMKRSPFENPYVMADQIGNWLDGWKAPPRGQSYASAPKLRSMPPGEHLYRTRCATCHTLTGQEEPDALGPDLLGVTRQREMEWLLNWLRAPDQMLASQDPIAMALYEKYNQLAMPNMRLNQQEAVDLIDYLDDETQRLTGNSEPYKESRFPAPGCAGRRPRSTAYNERSALLVPLASLDLPNQGLRVACGSQESAARLLAEARIANQSKPSGDVVAIMNARVLEAHPRAKVNAGYMTLVNVGSEEVTLVKVESEAFRNVEVHEMAMVDGLMEMKRIAYTSIPANGQTQLEPGGKHLMLLDPLAQLPAGRNVDMTLTFKSGRQQEVSFEVESR